MYYEDYLEALRAYRVCDREYQRVLSERESLFQMTQPKSTRLDQERVTGGTGDTAFDQYLIEKEKRRIDERLEEARKIVIARAGLLKEKEDLLYKSHDPADQVYRMRYIEGLKVSAISKAIHYSESQVYRFLKEINARM